MKKGMLDMAAALLCVMVAGSARAAVVLRSAEVAHGGGGIYQPGFGQPGGFFNPTSYSAAVPFPNDAAHFAGVGAEGLRVVARDVASRSYHLGNSHTESWSAHKFEVKFDLDEPAAYTFARTFVATDDVLASIKLQADGQPPVEPLPLFSEKSGVLPAGHYTFSGAIDGRGVGTPGAATDFTGSGGYNVVLTVVPEPGAVAALGALTFGLMRRRK